MQVFRPMFLLVFDLPLESSGKFAWGFSDLDLPDQSELSKLFFLRSRREEVLNVTFHYGISKLAAFNCVSGESLSLA